MHHSNYFPMAVLLRAVLLVLAASPLMSQQRMPAAAPRQPAVEGMYIPNRGQWSDSVRYKASITGQELWLTDDGWVTRVQRASKVPSSWSADKIMHYVSDIATDPKLTWKPQSGSGGMFTKKGRPAIFVVEGVREGILIRVIIEPAGRGIVSGFPIQ